MEINGTWYSIDCIKVVGLIQFAMKFNYTQKAFYNIGIVLGTQTSFEMITFDNKGQAEQSRKELIEQLNK